ncbi:MAG: tetratricopeptide repeat protein [Armatimonadetes bacterium]|nr:tetratricopeptide repeat protein [Armatimonadota bacterium]
MVALDQASAHMSLGEYTAAEAIYRNALATNEDTDLALALVDLYATWGRPEQGLQAIELAHTLGAPPDTTLQRQLELAAMAADWDLVIETARARLEAAPNDPPALTSLLQAHLRQGACDHAADAARSLTETGTTADSTTETLYLLEGDYAALQSKAPLLMAGLETCGDACDRQMGLRLVRAGRWSEAACLLERALIGADVEAATSATANPTESGRLGEAYAWLGEAKSRTGHPLAAEQHLRTAVDLAPASPLAWLLLGKQRLAQGDLETARVALLNAQRLDPANPAPCLAIAELKAQSGAYTEVNRWIDAALERAPGDAEVWKAAARFYLSLDLATQGDPAGIAAQAAILSPDDAEAHLLQGWSALVDGDAEAALEGLDRALTLDPNLAEGHYLRALALDAAGSTADAHAARIRAADLGWPRP